MLLTIAEFRKRVSDGLPGLIADLQATTGRKSPEEEAAWRASLPAVSQAFQATFFQPLQLYFGAAGGMCLEYRLPASSSWCDMVLLGSHEGKPSAAILELKHWETAGDTAGPVENLIRRSRGLDLHPSDQVRGYVEYCRNFHSTVVATGARTHGCVLFTKGRVSPAYSLPVHKNLVGEFPIFSIAYDSDREKLAAYLHTRLSKPDPQFAEDFVTGWYDQNRGFVRNIAETVVRSTDRPLVLLDRQRVGYSLAKLEVEKALAENVSDKKVIIVIGPPGSGKSVIAAKVWADVAAIDRGPNDRCVLTSTSKAQETNWKRLFQNIAHHHGAGGVVMPANKYAPATLRDLNNWIGTHRDEIGKPSEWRANLDWLAARGFHPIMPDDHFLLSVVDEAHALINPEHPRAITSSGWPNTFGPQAYHIIRSSRVSVFFLDPRQGFRERESTTIDEIRRWAGDYGVKEVTEISLEGLQFRCAGSAEYVEWVDTLLQGKTAADCAAKATFWTRSEATVAADAMGAPGIVLKTGRSGPQIPAFTLQVMDSLEEMETALRRRIQQGATARLVASFAREWKTEGQNQPHDLPPGEQDFCFSRKDGVRNRTWARPWNVAPRSDYSHFVQAVPGTRMAIDPLSEVGCTYAVRGFDFDYVGLLWLEDLVWTGDRWAVNLEDVHESGLYSTLKSARRKKNPDPRDREAVLSSIQQAYRILLTRALKGVYVWCVDPRTQEHLRSAIGVK